MPAQSSSPKSESTADREIVATRLFDAPRELVFEMWTDPKHVGQWWGPRGFTTTTQEMDVRPGGVWRFIMHGPDGTDYKNKIVYVEVVKPERLVYKHAGDDAESAHVNFRVTVMFTAKGNRTEIYMQMLFPSPAEREHVIQKYGAVEGMNQTLQRLQEQLAKHTRESGAGAESATQEFVISRVFDAPRELVWKAWTVGDRLAQWWGPRGFTIMVAKLELRPGGVFHYGMKSPDGRGMWGKFVFREIVPPERLAYVVSFSDEQGGITRHPLSATWPLEMLNIVTFTERDGKTTLTLRASAINASGEERRTFAGAFDSMRSGFSGTMDQLAEFLANNAS